MVDSRSRAPLVIGYERACDRCPAGDDEGCLYRTLSDHVELAYAADLVLKVASNGPEVVDQHVMVLGSEVPVGFQCSTIPMKGVVGGSKRVFDTVAS